MAVCLLCKHSIDGARSRIDRPGETLLLLRRPFPESTVLRLLRHRSPPRPVQLRSYRQHQPLALRLECAPQLQCLQPRHHLLATLQLILAPSHLEMGNGSRRLYIDDVFALHGQRSHFSRWRTGPQPRGQMDIQRLRAQAAVYFFMALITASSPTIPPSMDNISGVF